jgi:hypothetical protein
MSLLLGPILIRKQLDGMGWDSINVCMDGVLWIKGDEARRHALYDKREGECASHNVQIDVEQWRQSLLEKVRGTRTGNWAWSLNPSRSPGDQLILLLILSTQSFPHCPLSPG